MNRSQTHH